MKYSPRTYAKAFAEVATGSLSADKQVALVRNFVRAVESRGDRKKWPKILAGAEKALREKEGLRKVTFETARSQKDLRTRFKDLLQPSDIIEEKVDSQMVAGVKVTLNDTRQFDGSLRRRLDAIFSGK